MNASQRCKFYRGRHLETVVQISGASKQLIAMHVIPTVNHRHVVDTTLFFAPHSGGVKRYLLAKHAFFETLPDVRHTLVVPGAHDTACRDGIVEIGSPLVPFGAGYRLPLRLSAWR